MTNLQNKVSIKNICLIVIPALLAGITKKYLPLCFCQKCPNIWQDTFSLTSNSSLEHRELRNFSWEEQTIISCLAISPKYTVRNSKKLANFLSSIRYYPGHPQLKIILAWTRYKKTCSNRVPDMTCFAAKHLKFDSS